MTFLDNYGHTIKPTLIVGSAECLHDSNPMEFVDWEMHKDNSDNNDDGKAKILLRIQDRARNCEIFQSIAVHPLPLSNEKHASKNSK